MNITRITKVPQDKYTKFIKDKYDLQSVEEVTTEIPMLPVRELSSFDWNIGVVVGRSGSGKSTILDKLIETYEIKPLAPLDYGKPIVSQFPWLTEQEVAEIFYGIGLSSVPLWLHFPNQLSNGEHARFEMARALADRNNTVALIDEFTSVVHRDVAKSMSFALQKYIRSHNKKIIVASCHYDIFEWLQPDWIYNLNKRNAYNLCTIEKMIYKDEDGYDAFQAVDPEDVLSDARPVR